jgi:hypothetical protein
MAAFFAALATLLKFPHIALLRRASLAGMAVPEVIQLPNR